MKKLFLIGAILAGGITFMNAQEIELSESFVDMGNIEYNGKAITTVQIKNTGDKPLIVSSAKAGCGCTVPTWPKEPIAPGQSKPMTVEYTTTKRVGNFQKSVTINSNAVTEGRKMFRFKGVVDSNPNAPAKASATGVKKSTSSNAKATSLK